MEKINIGDSELELNPENTALFTYQRIGKAAVNLAIYDHIYIQNEDRVTYVFFGEAENEEKNNLINQMIEKGFPCVINQKAVSDYDLAVWEKLFIEQQLNDIDFVPDEWNN